jgi:N-acetylglucosamine-6-phosphate deacetylase
MPVNCIGLDYATGSAIDLRFSAAIESADSLISPPPGLPWLAPGFIDLQVNGFGGVDFNDPAAPLEEIGRAIRGLFATGVTRFFPTVITGSPEDMLGAIRNLIKAKESLPEGAAIEGLHVEGPYISPEDGARGAHPARWTRPPDWDEYRRWQDAAQGHIRLVTLSPEWPEAPAFIEAIVREGVVAAIGHTKAGTAEIAAAVSAGATLSTHLGNGAHAMLPRHPNYIWDQLAEDRLAATFIVDGVHLPASFLKVAFRAKGLEKCAVITDAVMPAGCPPGPYKLGEVDVVLGEDGVVRLASGKTLAGSALTMERAVANLVRLAGLELRDAVTLAARNPARIGRIEHRQRGLAAGERGDVVQFRFRKDPPALGIEKVWLSGREVYSALN